MTMTDSALPTWDMTPVFPSLQSDEFTASFDRAVKDIADLAAWCDAHSVRRRDTPTVDDKFVAEFEETTHHVNALKQGLDTLESYVMCFVTTDARDDAARMAQSRLGMERVKLDPFLTRYVAWIGTSDVDALLSRSEVARSHAYFLHKAQILASHQMAEEEEGLAAELRPTSITAWALLHGNMSALLSATVDVRRETKTLPISEVCSLSSDPDREVRRAAFEAEMQAWESVSLPFAAALNGIKGFQQVLRRRRHYADDVEPTLLSNGIDRVTLDAMHRACRESFPDFRRYLRAKARALGVEKLAWYDVNAPVGSETRYWTWDEATQFIAQNFGAYSDRMADFARRSFDEQWIDAGPRLGKEGGAYCTALVPGVSRVMMNFDGSFTAVSTLAHELGHAYHNLNLADRTPLQEQTPAALAETASIFCETLAFEAALGRANGQERLALLDTALQRDLLVVVDIHSRFLFESAVFERRASRDLTVSEFNALMLDAQRQTYGPDVDPLHPYMWALKGHYYGPLFYNYPYTFGLLFGIGLYAEYRKDPDGFRPRYDELLSSTGLADAATLAQRFGIDIRREEFWRAGLDVIRAQIDAFERLV